MPAFVDDKTYPVVIGLPNEGSLVFTAVLTYVVVAYVDKSRILLTHAVPLYFNI